MMGNTLVPGNACEVELARMMKQYGGMLVGTCTMLLGDADLAQDAVQEAFIRAYHKMDSFRSEFEGSEKAWLTPHCHQCMQGSPKIKVVFAL